MKNKTLLYVSLAALAGAAVFLFTRPSKAAALPPSGGPKPLPQPQPAGNVVRMPEVTVTSDGSGGPAWIGPLPPSPESYKTGLTTLWVQKFLSALAKIESNTDFDPKSLAGVWDGPTAQAVEVYQVDRRLGVDGKVGPQTAAAMKADYAKYASRSANV